MKKYSHIKNISKAISVVLLSIIVGITCININPVAAGSGTGGGSGSPFGNNLVANGSGDIVSSGAKAKVGDVFYHTKKTNKKAAKICSNTTIYQTSIYEVKKVQKDGTISQIEGYPAFYTVYGEFNDYYYYDSTEQKMKYRGYPADKNGNKKDYLKKTIKTTDPMNTYLYRYTIIPRGALKNIDVVSCMDGNGNGFAVKGRKSVLGYAKSSGFNKKILAVNGNYWDGPWSGVSTIAQYNNKFYDKKTGKSIRNGLSEWYGNLSIDDHNYDSKLIKIVGVSKSKGKKLERGEVVAKRGDPLKGWLGFDSKYNVHSGKYVPETGEIIAVNGTKENPNNSNVVIGGCLLLKNGQYLVSNSNNGDEVCSTASGGSKTIIGANQDGDIIIISTNGRYKNNKQTNAFNSFTPIQLASIAYGLGCTDAICVDGGGSTSFVCGPRATALKDFAAIGGKMKTSGGRAVANCMIFEFN